MKQISLYMVWLLLILPLKAYCTVDVLAANHITKKLYVFEEMPLIGIGWEAVAGEETVWEKQEKILLAKGYKYTSNPYKLDNIVLCTSFFLIGTFDDALEKKIIDKKE